MRATRHRRWTVLALAIFASVAGAAAPVEAAGTNLLVNGDFEGTGSGSLSGWKTSNASLSLVTGDGGGFAAKVTYGGSGTTYSIVASAKVVASGVAGTEYLADGRFNALSGKSVCLKLHETGAVNTSVTSCLTGTGAWATLPELSYILQHDGDGLIFSVFQKKPVSGDSFRVDNLAVTTTARLAPPTNLRATAVSSSEIDLTWTASPSGGVTGYNIYRDGGGTPIGSVNAPTTAFQDTGLGAGTTHTYVVTAVNATTESAPSNEASATTQGGTSKTIAAAGDIACSPRDPNYNGGAGTGSLLTGSCHQAATADLIGQGSYDRVLPLGDLQYDCGDLTSFNTSYDPTWGRFDSITEPVLGNHEIKTTSDDGDTGCSASGSGYFTYFANHGVTDAAGVNGKGYYSYDLGSWHVLAINTQCGQVGGCGVNSPEEKWIKSDLAAHPAQCTLAYWHQASWSSVTGGASNTRTFWTDMVNGGVDLVLTGHFHHYERFADLNASGQPVTSGARTREIIVGTGGQSEGPFPTPIAGSQVRIRAFGILALTLNSASYSWDFKPADPNGPTDSGAESCH
jgi:acid phosphatase type 7